jgi:hypothetical protein
MSKNKTVKSRALQVIDDMIRGETEEVALEKHNVKQEVLDRLLNNPEFAIVISNRIGFSIIRLKLLIAQYAQAATAKLIDLTQCEKEETSRKACLDIINLASRQSEPVIGREKVKVIEKSTGPVLTEEQASRILGALAGDEQE